MSVLYEARRNELKEIIKSLANPEYQRASWVNPDDPRKISAWEPMDIIHFFFDDTWLDTDPESSIGFILEGIQEVRLLQPLIEALDEVLNHFWIENYESAFLDSPEWAIVINIAKSLVGKLA